MGKWKPLVVTVAVMAAVAILGKMFFDGVSREQVEGQKSAPL